MPPPFATTRPIYPTTHRASDGGVNPPTRAPVSPPPEEFHQPQIAQCLQLLPDFVRHVAIRRVQRFEVRGKSVNILKREFFLVEPAHDVDLILKDPSRASYLVFRDL
jgi:hypothetical protein